MAKNGHFGHFGQSEVAENGPNQFPMPINLGIDNRNMFPCGHQLLIVFAICPPVDSSSDFWFSTSDIQIVLAAINRINTVIQYGFQSN